MHGGIYRCTGIYFFKSAIFPIAISEDFIYTFYYHSYKILKQIFRHIMEQVHHTQSLNFSVFAEKTTHFVRAYTYFSLAHVSARIIIREES